MKKVVLQKNWQSKGDRMKGFTGSDYPGIGHYSGHCRLNLIIRACGKQLTALHRLARRVEGGIVGVIFILKLLCHEDAFLFRFGTMKAKENCSGTLYPQHYTSAPPLACGFQCTQSKSSKSPS